MTNETPKLDSDPKTGITAKANLFWIALLVALTGSGIYYFLVNNAQLSWIGIALVVFGLLLFWLMDQDGNAPSPWLKIFERFASTSKIILLIAAVVFSISAAWMGLYLEGQSSPIVEDMILPLWGAAGLIVFLMYCRISWASLGLGWREYQREILAVALMTIFAALLRFYRLDSIPGIIEGDEGWTGMVSLKLLSYFSPFFYNNPFSFTQGFGRPYLDLFATAIDIFGRNKFGLRFIPALGGTLAIPATYLFARRLFGVRNAIIAALLLMVSHTHIHFSRTSALGYQQATWLAPLELYCFLKGLEERKRFWMVMSGLLLGLNFNVYFDAQILIPMTCVFLGMVAIISPDQITVGEKVIARPALPLRENLHNLPWFFGSILLLALPGLAWIYNHPAGFAQRFIEEGSIQSGWLMHQVEVTGKPVFLILWDRFTHVCMSIFILPFQDFYWVPVPVLDMITAMLFAIGAFLALRRTRDPKILLLNGWFWSGVVAIALFAVPPSADSYRLFMVLPAMCVLAALGWAHITSLAERLAQENWRMVVSTTVIMVVLVTGLNLKTYFLDFGRSCLYGSANYSTRKASLLGDYLRVQPAFDQAYLLEENDFYYTQNPALDFLSGSIPMINIPDPFTAPDAHGSTLFIIPSSREYERLAVETFAPGGQFTRVTDCGTLMFLAYRVYIP
jgi:4-amino-4-deoxy-L-arabinose transferase-like glycosyltransferase